MYTMAASKPDDCIHKRSHSHLSEKRQISKTQFLIKIKLCLK